jgi:hypothetical protein
LVIIIPQHRIIVHQRFVIRWTPEADLTFK